MADITTRAGKGSPLTHNEVDANFTNLNSDKIQSGDTVASLDINGGTIDNTVIGGSTPAAGSFTTGQFGTSLNVDGTVTADGLTVDGLSTLNSRINIGGSTASLVTGSSDPQIFRTTTGDGYAFGDLVIQGRSDAGGRSVYIAAGATPANRVKVQDNGDISFYEDTGTTPKFFWDASAESLGIGTSSPSSILHLEENDPKITLRDTSGASNAYFQIFAGGGSSQVATLDVDPNNVAAGSFLNFKIDGSEAMRIDSSGNLLVGKTANNTLGTAGANISADGWVQLTATSRPLMLNRLNSDGNILEFFKDGSTVGSIGNISSNIYIGNGDTGLGISASSDTLYPISATSGAIRDGGIDLGISAARFKDLYLSGGVYLGGTGSANKLDDYEEGTWTPELQFATSATYTSQQGIYRKIGTLVYIEWIINVSSHNTSDSSSIHINLPFAVAANDDVLVTINQLESTLLPRNSTVTTPGTGGRLVNGTNLVFSDAGTSEMKYSNTNSSGVFRGAATYISNA